MSFKISSLLSICLFFGILCVNTSAAQDLQTAITWENLLDDLQNDENLNDAMLDDLIPKSKVRTTYDVSSSAEKKFVFFRVFKVASGTLTHFFDSQVPDLTLSRTRGVPEEFKGYFKFAFVRNPWDRVVSCYFHKIVTEEDQSFQECFGKDFDYFVEYINRLDLTTADRHIRLQTRLIPYKQCDFIGKADNLVNDLEHICDVIGLEKGKISHRHKTDHAHYSTYYNDRTKHIIAKKYEKDIETFGFTFETE